MIYRIHRLGSEVLGCQEAKCEAYLKGWLTIIDERLRINAQVTGADQAAHIRHKSGRRFKESKNDRGLTLFHFGPGQRCFGRHDRAYGIFQRRPPREDFTTIMFDRWMGEWNETVTKATV